MSKKALAIIGLAAVIALSTGVITYVSVSNHSDSGDSAAPTQAVTSVGESVDAVVESDVAEPTDEEPTVPEQSADDKNGDLYGYADALSRAGVYRVRRVYDHAADCEVTAREVFGKLYSYCSLSFDEDGGFELCINPTSGEVRRGTFSVYGDVISVVYADGRGSEFTIVNDTPGEIDYIVVNYGDYDVYFGLN